MKLSNTDIITLVGSQAFSTVGSLREMHGKKVPLRDADRNLVLDEKKQPVMEDVPYKFATGVRTKLAIVLHKLFPIAQAFEEERVDLVRDFKRKARAAHDEAKKDAAEPEFSAELEGSNPVYAEFNRALNALLAEEHTIGVARLRESDIAADKNELPPTVLAGLLPILDIPDTPADE